MRSHRVAPWQRGYWRTFTGDLKPDFQPEWVSNLFNRVIPSICHPSTRRHASSDNVPPLDGICSADSARVHRADYARGDKLWCNDSCNLANVHQMVSNQIKNTNFDPNLQQIITKLMPLYSTYQAPLNDPNFNLLAWFSQKLIYLLMLFILLTCNASSTGQLKNN